MFGYKGKRVRDNIHSPPRRGPFHGGLCRPRPARRRGLDAGGKTNGTSILEAFKITEKFSGRPQVHAYVDQNRIGDHICYYSDLRKMRAHYPSWEITQSLEETIRQIVEAWRAKIGKAHG